jgi:hypothetical protein
MATVSTMFSRHNPAQGVVTQYFEFAVFDCWGALLFHTNEPRVGWDGFFNDQPMDTGVVAWYLGAKVTVCGREMEVFKEGGVTVMR